MSVLAGARHLAAKALKLNDESKRWDSPRQFCVGAAPVSASADPGRLDADSAAPLLSQRLQLGSPRIMVATRASVGARSSIATFSPCSGACWRRTAAGKEIREYDGQSRVPVTRAQYWRRLFLRERSMSRSLHASGVNGQENRPAAHTPAHLAHHSAASGYFLKTMSRILTGGSLRSQVSPRRVGAASRWTLQTGL